MMARAFQQILSEEVSCIMAQIVSDPLPAPLEECAEVANQRAQLDCSLADVDKAWAAIDKLKL